MLNLMTPELRTNPFPMYALMRQQAPLMYLPDYDIWLAFRYDDVKAILNDYARFSSEYGRLQQERAYTDNVTAASVISQDPPRHTQLRGLISKAFTPRAIAEMEPQVQAITHELLDRVVARGQMDFIKEFASPLPLIVIAGMLGIPTDRLDDFKRWSDAVIANADSFVTSQVDPEDVKSAAEMHAYFAEVIQYRRAHPGGTDLISRLLTVELEGEKLSDADVLAFCWLLLIAGNETTTNLIGNALLTFMEQPEIVHKLQANPALIPQAIEEVLRYRSPVQSMFRIVQQETTIGGQTLQPGQKVMVFMGSANRDPERFSEPDQFQIDRESNPHVAFGHGIHFCLGAPLARLEAKAALTILLERFTDFRRVDDEPLTPVRGLLVHGVASLPIRFTVR